MPGRARGPRRGKGRQARDGDTPPAVVNGNGEMCNEMVTARQTCCGTSEIPGRPTPAAGVEAATPAVGPDDDRVIDLTQPDPVGLRRREPTSTVAPRLDAPTP
jgi:hypothetical protein